MNPKTMPVGDKGQDQVSLERTTFIDEIIWREEYQASLGPRKISLKGSTLVITHVEKYFASLEVEILDRIIGSVAREGKSFQYLSTGHPDIHNIIEGQSYNLREGGGETSYPNFQ